MASFRAENNNSVPVFPMLSKHVHFQGMACWTKSIAERTLKSSTLYVFCFYVVSCIAAMVGWKATLGTSPVAWLIFAHILFNQRVQAYKWKYPISKHLFQCNRAMCFLRDSRVALTLEEVGQTKPPVSTCLASICVFMWDTFLDPKVHCKQNHCPASSLRMLATMRSSSSEEKQTSLVIVYRLVHARHVLPEGFSCWTNVGADQALESTRFYMFRLDMSSHVAAFSRAERTLETEPGSGGVFLHVILNQGVQA